MLTNNLLINERYYITTIYNIIFVAKLTKINSNSLIFNEYIDTDGTTDLSYSVIPISNIKNIKSLYEVNFINFKLNLQLDLLNVNKILLSLNKNFRYYIFFKENLNKQTKLIQLYKYIFINIDLQSSVLMCRFFSFLFFLLILFNVI